VKVVWTDRARQHLRAIHEYIAQDSPIAATRFVDRLTRKSESLARFPSIGHVVPEYETEPSSSAVRQILEGSYRVIYRVTPDRIEVIAVIHGARQLPPLDGLR
jgi:plasmid stabilization system protein ParE